MTCVFWLNGHLISMTELLTTEEFAAAAAMGWTLCDVYDSDLERWMIVVMPLTIGQQPMANAEQAGSFVINLARQGHALAVKALQIVMAGHTPKESKK